MTFIKLYDSGLRHSRQKIYQNSLTRINCSKSKEPFYVEITENLCEIPYFSENKEPQNK